MTDRELSGDILTISGMRAQCRSGRQYDTPPRDTGQDHAYGLGERFSDLEKEFIPHIVSQSRQ